jgi:hypothetical protein
MQELSPTSKSCRHSHALQQLAAIAATDSCAVCLSAQTCLQPARRSFVQPWLSAQVNFFSVSCSALLTTLHGDPGRVRYWPANLRRMSAALPACCVSTAPNSIAGATLPAALMARRVPLSAPPACHSTTQYTESLNKLFTAIAQLSIAAVLLQTLRGQAPHLRALQRILLALWQLLPLLHLL